MDTKTCKWCGEKKAAEEFYKHPMMADGRLNKCKACLKKYRDENIEQIRLIDAKRSKKPARIAQIQARTKRYRLENPDRFSAHNKVSYAIRSGKLTKLPCKVCGSIKSHAHHDDYTKPLDVVWLCAIHHREEHERMKENK
jgi:hypothetical protein